MVISRLNIIVQNYRMKYFKKGITVTSHNLGKKNLGIKILSEFSKLYKNV